jgi:hypothetical protein
MDILNFISWIKAGNYREILPTETTNLLAIGAKDPNRDDAYLSLAVNAAPLQSLYNTGAVRQDLLFNITQPVTLNAHAGTIVTVGAATLPGTPDVFLFNNTNIKPNSLLFLSVDYPSTGTGTPVVSSEINPIGGVARIIIRNPDSSAPLDQPLNIYFLIVNPQ